MLVPLVFVSLVTISMAQTGDWHIPGKSIGLNDAIRGRSSFLSRAVPVYNANCDNGVVGIFCSNCRSLIVCNGKNTIVSEKTCGELTNNVNTFCTNNECAVSKNLEDTTCVTAKPFICTGTGFFPDELDCTVYHQCKSAANVFTLVDSYECVPGYVYDTKTPGFCARKLIATDCKAFNCTGVANNFIVHPADPNYYAFCAVSATNVKSTTVFQCAAAPNGVFNPLTKGCEFNCKAEGRFASGTFGGYYECYFNGTKLTAIRKQCPVNIAFDPKTGVCTA